MTEPDSDTGVTMDTPPPNSDEGATLQTVLHQIEKVPELHPRERRELQSAVHSFAGKLNRQPCDIPARLEVIERLGRELNAVRLGITAGRLRNIRSLVRKALMATGHGTAMSRLDFPLERPWAALVELFRDRRNRIALARLFRIFQVIDVKPTEVSPAAFQRVLGYLRTTATSRPEANYRELVLAWNRLQTLLRPYRT